jgi:hypothetical protein
MGHPLSVPGDFVLVSAEVVKRSLCPVHGEAQALARSIAIRRVLSALVESHGDVRGEGDLDIHGMLGREEMTAAVKMRTEVHALVAHLA